MDLRSPCTYLQLLEKPWELLTNPERREGPEASEPGRLQSTPKRAVFLISLLLSRALFLRS